MAMHTVKKTRTEHLCHRCDEVIPKGSTAQYRNTFTGARDYYHYGECPRFKKVT